MREIAFPLLLLLGPAAFIAVPSAFMFRAAWRAAGWRRASAVALLGLLLISVICGSLSTPFEWQAQWEMAIGVVSLSGLGLFAVLIVRALLRLVVWAAGKLGLTERLLRRSQP